MYGFSKTRHDSNHHEFMHKLFQRGRRDLLPIIRRKTHHNSTKNVAVDVPSACERTSGENKEFATAPPLSQGSFMTLQANISSETSQSSHGADEDISEFEPTIVEALQSQIFCLEEHVDRLTKVCNDLLTQHNLLCEALNKASRVSSTSSLNPFGNSPSALLKIQNSLSTNSFEDASIYCNDNRPSSNSSSSSNSISVKHRLEDSESSSDKDEQCLQELFHRPLKRHKTANSAHAYSMTDGIDSCPEKNEYGNSSIIAHNDKNAESTSFVVKAERGASISSHSDTTTSSAASMASRSPATELDFLDFKVNKYELPSFVSDVHKTAMAKSNNTKSGQIVSTKSSDHRSRANQHCYSHGDPDIALLVAKAGGNFDLGGLAAITDAASLLEDDRHDGPALAFDDYTFRIKYPLFPASAYAASHIGETAALSSIYSTVGSQQDLQVLQETTEVLKVQGPKPGGALLKAYSIG
jgi:hypothetical protein